MADLAIIPVREELAIEIDMPAYPHVAFDHHRLLIADDIPYDEWERLGSALRTMEENSQFWLGDWLRFGNRKWGEMYSQAIQETTGYKANSLAKLKYVAERIEPDRRHENLSHSHHEEVAPESPEVQDELLALAEERGLTSKELHEERLARKVLSPEGRVWNIVVRASSDDWLELETVTAPSYGAEVDSNGVIYFSDAAGHEFIVPDLADFVRKLYALKAEAKRHFGEWPQK